MQAVIDAIADGSLTATCAGVIADHKDRECVRSAIKSDIPVWVIGKSKSNQSREDYDRLIAEKIPKHTDIIACIGWMRILSPWFVRKFSNRIINVHPSLLPKHPGLNAHSDVIKSNDKTSGMTIHVVTEHVDEGPILMQKSCPVLSGDTPESLKTRVQQLEKKWYPKVLQMIENGELRW
jgi:phosphoribosylglycinamide formyltransferase 1